MGDSVSQARLPATRRMSLQERREIIWIEDVAMDYWSSDYSGYVIIDEYQGSTTYTYYDIPRHAGPYARWSVFLGKVYVPTRPRGIL